MSRNTRTQTNKPLLAPRMHMRHILLRPTLARVAVGGCEGPAIQEFITIVYAQGPRTQMVVPLNYCSQNGGNVYSAPYYNGNPNIGPRIIGNLDQSPNNRVVGPKLQARGANRVL